MRENFIQFTLQNVSSFSNVKRIVNFVAQVVNCKFFEEFIFSW